MLAQRGGIWAEAGGEVACQNGYFARAPGNSQWALLCVPAVSPSDADSGFVHFCSDASCFK